jgi:hypothetical protein
MSSEIVILLLFFVLLPFVQQVLRYVLQGRAPERDSGAPATAEEPVRAGPRAPERAEPPEASRCSAASGEEPAMPGVTARRRQPPLHRTVEALHGRRGLARGIVLMTVLGPCRANAPYD